MKITQKKLSHFTHQLETSKDILERVRDQLGGANEAVHELADANKQLAAAITEAVRAQTTLKVSKHGTVQLIKAGKGNVFDGFIKHLNADPVLLDAYVSLLDKIESLKSERIPSGATVKQVLEEARFLCSDVRHWTHPRGSMKSLLDRGLLVKLGKVDGGLKRAVQAHALTPLGIRIVCAVDVIDGKARKIGDGIDS